MSAVLDSNILIYHLSGLLEGAAESMVKGAIGSGAVISVVSRIEILGWPDHTPESYDRAARLIGLVTEHPLTNVVVERCIAIRRQQRVRIPDAIIAATAIELGLPVMTHNTGDFGRIDGLRVMDPLD